MATNREAINVLMEQLWVPDAADYSMGRLLELLADAERRGELKGLEWATDAIERVRNRGAAMILVCDRIDELKSATSSDEGEET